MFLINRGDLEDRLDARFYKALQNLIYKKLIFSKYPVFKLGELSTLVTKGETPLWRGDGYIKTGIPFLRGKDIKHGEIIFNDTVYISPDVHKRMLRSQLNSDCFLLTMAGTLGDVAYFKEGYPESNINQDIAKIKLTKNISYQYAVSFFSTQLALTQINILSNGGTRNHLNFSQIKKFKIILPPEDIQQKIVDYQEEVNKIKLQKEAQASALLASIDSYLLQELGITLPPPSEKKTYFMTRSSQISGNRFDPFYHQVEFNRLEQALVTSKYDIQNFSNLINYISSGATPLKSNSEKYYTNDSENGIPLLRVQNITAEGLKLDDVVFINREIHEKDLKRSQVFSGDLLITITGRIASSAVAPQQFEGNINQHSVVVRTKNNVLNDYLAIYFNSLLGQKFALRKTTGGTRPALDYCALKSIKIPLPSLEKQTEIANHINAIRVQAKQLQNQASEELERAKQQVEHMILGK